MSVNEARYAACVSRSLAEVGLALKRVQATHHRELDAGLAELGLSLVQWDALRHLAEHPEASLHDLALLTFQSDQSFGTLARRMVARGLVTRAPGPGRAVRLNMTPRGQQLVGQGAAVADRVLARTLGTLSPRQLEVLGKTLEQLVG